MIGNIVRMVLLSSLAFGSNAMANGWYSDFKIAEIQYSRGANGAHIVFSSGTGNPNPDNCVNSDRFLIPYTSSVPEREKAMLSGLSMAFAANKSVKVLLSGCQEGIGGKTYPVVHYLFVKQ